MSQHGLHQATFVHFYNLAVLAEERERLQGYRVAVVSLLLAGFRTKEAVVLWVGVGEMRQVLFRVVLLFLPNTPQGFAPQLLVKPKPEGLIPHGAELERA